ncbi:CPBP family intramembrane glutamic endopeptidase [Corynebacterium freiburgense]|uniref:CPBP family intramembrane glutamic endopeptidase n=1 Tax=Corynebacterium freiburgense TaxID=556548 RepID=UPI00040730F8|nr:CPBP family intramembrane glutamic endopeptidase [Corynebacterium freiburgense]WJZ01997.1 CAAX amino terminal protease self- immunity [Corynebacterium freiburgense]
MEVKEYSLKSTIIFYVIASLLFWILAIPLWLVDEQTKFLIILPLLLLAMFTPTVAAVFVARYLHKVAWKQVPSFLNITIRQPYKKTVVWILVSMALAILIPVISSFIAAAFGWFRLDLLNFSAFESNLQALSKESDQPALPVKVLLLIQIASIPFSGLFNSFFAAGEEIGWRGYLLPALQKYGVWPALLISGALWGLWHSPVILIGYNFNRTDWVGVAVMTIGCMFLGVIIGFTQIFSGNIWPAAIFHGTFNAAAGLPILLGHIDQEPDPIKFLALGYPGWITALIILVFFIPLYMRHVRQHASQTGD